MDDAVADRLDDLELLGDLPDDLVLLPVADADNVALADCVIKDESVVLHEFDAKCVHEADWVSEPE